MYNIVFLNGVRLGVSEHPMLPSDRLIIAKGTIFTSEIYRFILKMGASDFDRAVDDCIGFAIKKFHIEMDNKLEIQRRMWNLEKGININYVEFRKRRKKKFRCSRVITFCTLAVVLMSLMCC